MYFSFQERETNNMWYDEMLVLTNEYLFPSQITKPTLSKWIVECIAECVEWEAELSTEEKDGGSKKSGQDNMPDDSHKLAWVQLMSEARALTVEDRPGSAQKKQEVKFDGLTGKTITPSLSAPSCLPRATATRSRRRTWCDRAALHSPSCGWGGESGARAARIVPDSRVPLALRFLPLPPNHRWRMVVAPRVGVASRETGTICAARAPLLSYSQEGNDARPHRRVRIASATP